MLEKNLLVLGASSDLGIAFLRAEIKGYDYVIAHYCNNVVPLLQLKQEYPEKLCLKKADFSKKDEIEQFVREIFQEGRVPVYLVHFPAVKCKLRRFDKIPYDEFQTCMQVSVNSILLILQSLLPHMVKQHYGKIVFVLSIHTLTGPHKYISDYMMAKYALLSLMESLTAEYRDKGIRINSISPDTIETKFISELPELSVENKKNSNVTGKLLDVSDIIPTIAYLLNKESDSLYGQNIGITS